MILKLFVSVLILEQTIFALPKDEKKDRVYNREVSDKEHFENDLHNPEFDHEAFLGEEAKTFDQLPPEESKRRLGSIVDEIDINKDGLVSLEELNDWNYASRIRSLIADADSRWKVDNPADKTAISWEDYRKVYHASEEGATEENSTSPVIMKHKKRWSLADVNEDGKLSKQEFAMFLNPGDTEHMRDLFVEEAIEDVDKDKDGKISKDEFFGNMWDQNQEEPDWVQGEREKFNKLDQNMDGFIDKDEAKPWILPLSIIEAESNNLIENADQDGDQKLSKDEILKAFHLFVDSQATNYGDDLTRHEEL